MDRRSSIAPGGEIQPHAHHPLQEGIRLRQRGRRQPDLSRREDAKPAHSFDGCAACVLEVGGRRLESRGTRLAVDQGAGPRQARQPTSIRTCIRRPSPVRRGGVPRSARWAPRRRTSRIREWGLETSSSSSAGFERCTRPFEVGVLAPNLLTFTCSSGGFRSDRSCQLGNHRLKWSGNTPGWPITLTFTCLHRTTRSTSRPGRWACQASAMLRYQVPACSGVYPGALSSRSLASHSGRSGRSRHGWRHGRGRRP